ncbi:hypothetical protein [Staphylococcus pettenkoferi]|uniref:hypothetical protein n=1 Tax=Staphylococcus pettenkoferi TaxID=170573 RepID=UPI0011A5E3D2|nr:hypothetical protein [Staphylococcus pettenkoferi]
MRKESRMYSGRKGGIDRIREGVEKEVGGRGMRVRSIWGGMVERGLGSGDCGDGKKVEGKNIGEGVVYGVEEGSDVNVNEIRVRGV